MVKTPRTRHSKSQREPVTIDLAPDQVKREEKTATAADKPSGSGGKNPSDPVTAKTTQTGKTAQQKDTVGTAASSTSSAGDGKEDTTKKAGAKTQPGAEKPSEQTKDRGPRGGAAFLGAGAAGGVIALALAAGLQWSGVLPGLQREEASSEDAAIETLQTQITALESKLSNVAGAAAPLDSNVLDEALENVRQDAEAQKQEVANLNERLASLQESIASGEAGAGDGLDQLSSRLFTLEEKIGEGGRGADAGPALETLRGQVNTLQGKLSEVDAALQETKQAVSSNSDGLSGVEEKISALSERVENNADNPRMAQLIAATALKSAVERGTPFASELDTYSAVAPPEAVEALAPLRAHAEKGVPSRSSLAAAAPDAASRIVAAADRENSAGDGIISSLMSSAKSLVVVRPVGSVEGEGPAAVAARMEAAVLANDYEKALAEYQMLPEAAQKAARDFADGLAARQAADQALDKALSNALKGA